VLVGGAGFVGTAASGVLVDSGAEVTVVDRNPPPADRPGVRWARRDLLTDDPDLPDGRVVVLLGGADPRTRWPWTLAMDGPLATARLRTALAGRDVTLLSSVEVYGSAPAPLREDTQPLLPWTDVELAAWCDEATGLAASPCPPYRAAGLCRRLADADPSGRWVYALAKQAQERLVAAAGPDRLTVLRLANVYGPGQERVVTRLLRAALAGRPLEVTAGVVRSFLPVADVGRLLLADLGPGIFNVGGPPLALTDLAEAIRAACGSASPLRLRAAPAVDSCGAVDTTRLAEAGFRVAPVGPAGLARLAAELRDHGGPLFDPPLPVVVPPRPARPDEVADRQQACLWSGTLKHGNRWSEEVGQRLRKELELREDVQLLPTTSGTAALRLAVAAVARQPGGGRLALLPSFTFPATAEVLVQLGYRLRFVDVDEDSWTLDPALVAAALQVEPAGLVMCVDTFGDPCDYDGLRAVCDAAGVPLVADSAAALGSLHRGRPVAGQAAAHAYSMSFAKVLSAGGAGGAALLPAGASLPEQAGWARSALMNELHAVVALDQLAILDDLVDRRQRVAAVYREAAARLGLPVQRVADGHRHSYVHFVVRLPPGRDREALAEALARLGVGTKPYFRALHRHGFRGGPGQPDLPVTDALDADALALPMSSELTEEDAERVVVAVEHALG
jgi:dTDP-4-amino-4,6-dideoxygalactose transaminase/nucleoside-diphosphate-sugar epimerase